MRLTSILTILCLIGTSSFAACNKPSYSGAYLKTIPTKNINQKLFGEALATEANYFRCKSGRKPVAHNVKLTSVAAPHSKWMAQKKKLSHKGAQSFKRRMRGSGVKFKTAAENIAAFDRFSFPKGKFKVRNAAACKFSTQSGKAIPAHTYASLARTVVAGWSKSSGHKKNLLNRRVNQAGGGVWFDHKAPLCGRFYITQNYTD